MSSGSNCHCKRRSRRCHRHHRNPVSSGFIGNPDSSANGLAQYAYIYNLSSQTVLVESDVTFDTSGLTTSGIVFSPGTSNILINDGGDYKVSFSLTAVTANQFALFVDGVLVPGTIYGNGVGPLQNNGQAIFTINSGSTLTLRNHTSTIAAILFVFAGGSQTTTNASIVIEKLN